MRIAIHINYYLFQEIRIVILGIHIQRLAKNRNVSRHARSVIPRFLLIQMRGNLHFTAACQKIVILCQYMIGTVSLTGRQTKMQILIRIILDVCTRCYKETMFAAVIPSDTAHQHQLVIQIECILDICSRNRLLHIFLRQSIFHLIRQPVMLIVTIIIET